MPKRKDLLLIVLILVLAAAMLGISKLMPKTDLSEKVAQATLAPDAIEYVEATEAPTEAPTAEPTQAPTAEPTEIPAATAEPTEMPTAEPTQAPTAEPRQEAAMIGPMPPKKAEVVRGHVVLTGGGRQ